MNERTINRKMGNSRVRKYISLLILCITFAVYLGATCGNEWLIYDTDHVGLWQICRENECLWMEYTPSYTSKSLTRINGHSREINVDHWLLYYFFLNQLSRFLSIYLEDETIHLNEVIK